MSEQAPARPSAAARTGRPAEKPKDFKKASGQLLAFLKPFLALVVVALVFAVAGRCSTSSAPTF